MRATEPDPGALFFLVLAAGRGVRMGPLGDVRPKSLLPVLDRPLIDWQLECLRSRGLTSGCLVVGHRAEALFEHVGDGRRFGVALRVARQDEPLGIAHAVACAAPLPADAFVCVLGDVWVDPHALEVVMRTFVESGADGVLGFLPAADAATRARNYALETVVDGGRVRVTGVIEKPRDGRPGATGVGLYAFRSTFLDAVARTPPSALRGEREITDAIATFIEDGARVVAAPVAGPDFNLSGPDDLLALNLHALRRESRATFVAADARVEAGAELTDAVVGAGARVRAGARLVRALVMPGEVVPAGDYRAGLFADGRWIPEGAGPAR